MLAPSPLAAKTLLSPDTSRLAAPFVVADVYGKKLDLVLLRNKVIFINFWALTCAPCKAELPTINNLASHYKNDTNFLILPIDLDHKLQEDMQYFNEQKLTLTAYMPSGVVPQELFLGALPTTAVIDKTGKIVFLRQEEGQYDTPSFFQFVDSLLRQ